MRSARLVASLVGLVACGTEEPAPEVTIAAPGARWMAVRTEDAPAWTRVDAPVHRLATPGWFEVAVVCREDVGAGWTWLATAADRADDPRWERRCDDLPGGATVVFDVAGRVDEIYVGTSRSFGPDYFSAEVAPGTYDVVAVRRSLDRRRAERVQIVRGVTLAPGTTRVPIDVEAEGAATVDTTFEVNGVRAGFYTYNGWTAGGTSFWLGAGGALVALEPSQRIDGDRELVDAPTVGGGWVQAEIHAGANAVRADLPPHDFAWAEDALAVTWTSPERWESVYLFAADNASGDIAFPVWSIEASAGALDARATGGGETLAIEAPDVPGWQASWMPAPASPQRRTVRWRRPRPDGWEGYRGSEVFGAPAP